jgi:hypothetical protein
MRSVSAGLTTTLRETSTSVETVTVADEAGAEDQIGLTKAKRRDLQRRLTKLGFGTKINGEFDESTRAAIARLAGAACASLLGKGVRLSDIRSPTQGKQTSPRSCSPTTGFFSG